MNLICMECGKHFTSQKAEPQCPRCGGYDIEPNYEKYYPSQVLHKLRLTALETRHG